MGVDRGRRHWVVSGGIGSGKSAVRRLLEEHGFFTIDADSVGHEVIAEGGPAFRQVSRRWPEVVEDGGINRSELGRIVFGDSGALRELEQITHPHIFGTIQQRVQGIRDPVAVEVPLLENKLGEGWGRVIVDCQDSERMARLLAKGMGAADASARMSSQPSRQQWLSVADVVIPNHGDHESLELTVGQFVAALSS